MTERAARAIGVALGIVGVALLLVSACLGLAKWIALRTAR